MEMRNRGSYTVYQTETPQDYSRKDMHNIKVMDIPTFFHPLVTCMQCLGFVISERGKDTHRMSEKTRIVTLKSIRTVYLSLMWIWTVVMSVNIIWLVIAHSNEQETNPVDGRRENMIITLLNESPYAFITIRNAVVLTLFVRNGPKIFNAVRWCEDLRYKFGVYGVTLSMDKSSRRPLKIITASVLVVVLWEVHEWTVWFSTLGILYSWNFAPFPFALAHYYYAALWWAFTSVPFIFAQLSLAFPVLFACIARKFIKVLNNELGRLTFESGANSGPGTRRLDFGQRLLKLRELHFEINELIAKIDKYIRGMLLWQFILDISVLFGFVGLSINSKYAKPPKLAIEWTFLISTSVIWFGFFLLYFSITAIQMANEGEKTHHLVHALTTSPGWQHRGYRKDLHIFLEETGHSSAAFTGGNFFYINRHYIVTCFALLASEIMVFVEISDRFYGTLEMKTEVEHLRKFMENFTAVFNCSIHGGTGNHHK